MEVDVAKAGECFTPDHHQFVLYVVPPRPECAPGETEQQTICHHPIVFRVVNTGHIGQGSNNHHVDLVIWLYL